MLPSASPQSSNISHIPLSVGLVADPVSQDQPVSQSKPDRGDQHVNLVSQDLQAAIYPTNVHKDDRGSQDSLEELGTSVDPLETKVRIYRIAGNIGGN